MSESGRGGVALRYLVDAVGIEPGEDAALAGRGVPADERLDLSDLGEDVGEERHVPLVLLGEAAMMRYGPS